MVKVGITGGIGSGKSIVCNAFELFSVPLYNADDKAKYLIENDIACKNEIKNVFGEEAYFLNGKYNRRHIAEIVFKLPEMLSKLNSIVHPRVKQDAEIWFEAHKNQPYVIYEAALMNAAKKGNQLDCVIAVLSTEKERTKRILNRDTHRTEADIKAIFKNQKSESEFIDIADYLIINNETDLLLPQVISLHHKFIKN